MNYHFDYSWLGEYWPILLKGIGITLQLSVTGAVFGIALGIFCAWVRQDGPAWLRWIVACYVELIRNTPFLIQLFFVFFGLPATGLHMTELQAASLAMILNLGAYSCEIIRAGIKATPKGQYEAGAALAMNRLQIFRRIVLKPALQRIWPALSSQVVIVMLGSAVCSQISAEDLTYAASFIQSRNFRAFETVFVSTLIYLMLSILVRKVMQLIGLWIFPKRGVAR
ncbi:amino acid ABC transporter permease [soil metagenome]